ncbi:hypothetical protein [Enterococcus sp. DIV0660C]|uniref:hypothetical protein n=1 Tax=Enterococcus sp. DIV0660C TaxID=2230880 RepID=UPI001A8EEA28|nr:hypothetical protein [Enterococcus sp. DIV0660C]MBO0430851.1 hypothetical protein [Enterococcus sp. DIV0660C]
MAPDFTEDDQQTEQNGLFQTYTKEINDVSIQIDKENKKTTIQSDQYKKFFWVDDQDNRLMDANQVEYSFSKE